jgi:hypothetical protein
LTSVDVTTVSHGDWLERALGIRTLNQKKSGPQCAPEGPTLRQALFRIEPGSRLRWALHSLLAIGSKC